MPDTVSLGADDVVENRPFTSPDMTYRDLEIMHSMLADVRSIAADVEEGARRLDPYQKLAWRVGGLAHRLLICDFPRLRSHPGLCVVGFFGTFSKNVNLAVLEEANSAVVAQFPTYPGILSYGSVELPGGHWANLVLHDDPIDTSFWRESEMHQHAVKTLSPEHYRNVRIHNGRLSSGLFDRPAVDIHRTKYYDYSGTSEWRAERELTPT